MTRCFHLVNPINIRKKNSYEKKLFRENLMTLINTSLNNIYSTIPYLNIVASFGLFMHISNSDGFSTV